MSAVTDWLQAAGSLVGAAGGMAGFYALHAHRSDVRRRRLAPPSQLVDHALTLMDAGRRVITRGPQRDEYFQTQEFQRAYTELQRLSPLIKQAPLRDAVKSLLERWVALVAPEPVDARWTRGQFQWGSRPYHPDMTGTSLEPTENARRVRCHEAAKAVVEQAERVVMEFDQTR